MLRSGKTLKTKHVFWSDHGPNMSRSGGFLTISFFIDEEDADTVAFFTVMVNGVAQPRSKRVSNIMGAAMMVVLTLGMPEVEDG